MRPRPEVLDTSSIGPYPPARDLVAGPACEHVRQGALARPVGAHHHVHFAAVHLEVDAPQDLPAAHVGRQTLDQQRQKLQQQRDAALISLQSATTASDVQKYHAVIDSLNGAIAEVSHAEQELYHRTAFQNQQLQAGQQIYNAAQAQQQAAAAYQAIDNELSGLPANSFHQTVPFPQ